MGIFVWPEVDEPAQIAVALKVREQAEHIGIQVLMRKQVGKDEFKRKYVDDTIGGYPEHELTEDSDPNRVSHGYTEETKTNKNFSEYAKVTMKSVKDAVKPIDPFDDATKMLSGRQLLGEDVRVITALTDTGVITQTAAVSNAWSDTTNGDPEGDIKTAIKTIVEAGGGMPDTLMIGIQAAINLGKHPDVRDVLQHTSSDLLVKGILIPKLWGLDVFIAASAKKNAQNVFSQVLSNKAVVLRRKPHAGYPLGQTYYSEDFQIKIGAVSDNGRWRKVYSNYTYLPLVDVPGRAYILTAVDS